MGGVYEKVTRGATVEHVHYIPGGGGAVAVWKRITGGSTEVRYLHRDHQGSVVAATDYQGTVLERYSYDAWGKRRDPGSWVTPAVGTFSFDPAFNDRGYTGHEHVDHLGLVNMNGRVYDPEIGRFLSADPFVQFPESTQGANRFTYVGNNPLSYSDPSGFFSMRDFVKILGFAMSIIIPTGINLLWEKMLWGFVSGLMASGGDMKAAALGAMAGALFHGIGKLDLGPIRNAFAHSVASGALAEAGGGSFKAGFAGGALGAIGGATGAKLFGPAGTGGPAGAIKRTMVAATAGGIGSELGGGKFKTGAMTAAFSQMFNHEAAGIRQDAEMRQKLLEKYDGVILKFDGTDLRALSPKGDVLKIWPGTSGQPGSTPEDSFVEDYGPITEGDYSISATDSNYDAWYKDDWGSSTSWGDVRTKIQWSTDWSAGTRKPGTFYVHGGTIPGSAGCIDLTIYNNDFHDWIQMLNRPIPLRVDYPNYRSPHVAF